MLFRRAKMDCSNLIGGNTLIRSFSLDCEKIFTPFVGCGRLSNYCSIQKNALSIDKKKVVQHH